MTESRVVITAVATRAIEEFRRFRTEATNALEDVSKSGGFIGNALGAVGAALSVAAFTGWIKGAIDATDAASDLSQRTGVAIEDLAGLELALQMGGMEASALEGTMSKLSKEIVGGNAAFEKLGVKTKDATGQLKSSKDMLYELADKFANMEDGVQKVALAQEIFGKSGAAMLPVLNGGAEGLREMDEMARKLGLSLSQEAVDKAGEFNDTLDLLMLGTQGVARGVAAELLPTLSSLTGQFLTTMTSGDKLKNTAAFLATGLRILYTVGAGVVEVFSTVGKTVGAAAAQIVALMQGDFSMASQIGRQWLEDIGNGWKGTLASIEAAWAAATDSSVESMVNFTRHSTELGLSAAELAEQSKKAAKAQADEAKVLAELAGLTGSFAQEWDQLGALYAKGKISLEQLTQAQANLLAKQPAMKSALAAETKAREELADFEKKYTEAAAMTASLLAERVKDAEAEAVGNEALARTYGMSKMAIEQEEIARLESQLAQRTTLGLNETEVASLEKLIGVKRRNAAAIGAMEQVDAAKKAQEEWKRASDSIEQSLTDALLRGFESGQSIGKNLISTLKNMFSTLVLRPVISAVVSPLAAGLTGSLGLAGTANAATGAAGGTGALGSLAGLASGASNLYGMLTGGATLAGGVGTGFLGSLAGGLNGAGVGSGLTSALGLNIGNGIASIIGPEIAGALSSGLSGLAAAAPWVAGAVAVFSIAKKAFGHGPKEYSGNATLSGWINSSGGLDANMYAEWSKKGGWLSSTKTGSDRQDINADLAASILSTYETIKTSTMDYAKVLGINADFIANRAQGLNIAFGKDEDANKKALTDFFSTAADQVAREVLPAMDMFMREGETAAQTLQRMAINAAGMEQVLTSMGMTSSEVFGEAGAASMLARERLLQFAGGIEAFAANTAAFQQNFLTEAERNAPVLKSVTEQLAALGLAGVDTRDEFKQVVLGLDLATEAGAKQYGELMKLQGAFAQVYPAIDHAAIAAQELAKAEERANRVRDERAGLQERLDALTLTTTQLREQEIAKYDESNQALLRQIFAIEDHKAALQELEQAQLDAVQAQRNAAQAAKDRGADLLAGVDSAFSVLQAVVNREKALLQESANAHRNLSSALQGALDGMAVVGQERDDRIGAQAQIRAALAIAKASGVLPDASTLKGALSILSKDASSMFATQQDYLRDFYSTQNDIADLAGLTDKALSVDEQSLQALDAILANAQQQVDALKGIDTSIFSLAEAISGFQRAIDAAKEDQVASAGGELSKVYKELLGRQVDRSGLEFYTARMAEGVTIDQIREAIKTSDEYKALHGIPGFASGGMFGGGLRLVGENGPELEVTGPSRIFSASQTSDMLSRLASPAENSAALVAELRALRSEVGELRRVASRTADATEKTAGSAEQLAEQFDDVTEGGNAMRTDVVNTVETKEVA